MCQLELSGAGSFAVFSEVLSLFRIISNPTRAAAPLNNLIMQCKKRGAKRYGISPSSGYAAYCCVNDSPFLQSSFIFILKLCILCIK